MTMVHSFESASATLFTSAQLAASGAWTRGDSVIDVKKARELVMLIDYTAHASSTTGYPQIVPMVACTSVAPAAGDATWFIPGIHDGTLTATALAGSLPAGADFTVNPPMGVALLYPMVIRLNAATALSARTQMAVRINVAPFKWFQMMAAENGDTTNRGTLAVSYALSA
jgi:hypothetical protein